MAFNSVSYLVLLGVAVGIFWLLPPRLRRFFVFAASVAFYASWGWMFVWLPLLVALVVYLTGLRITGDAGRRATWARVGIVFVLALLMFFKYRGFLVDNLRSVGIVGSDASSFAAAIAFPLGISFYTFGAIGYLIDLRQGRVKLPRFFDLCLFFFFWPNILSGPIVRARELMPQLAFTKGFEPRFCFEGMDRLVWGLVQKNAIANVLGIWVNRGFDSNNGGGLTTPDAWLLAIAFALQIYFDFAAYTNMAIGAARLLGVTLPENFRQPYHAATPPEFWSRWHMTLSRWVRDYLFFPLNAKWAGAPAPLYLSLIGVMALVGLWHGAGWGFLLWGVLHGVYLAVYRAYEKWQGVAPATGGGALASLAWRLLTIVAVVVAWVPFRAPSLHRAGEILASMFFRLSGGSAYGGAFYGFTLFVGLLCAIEPVLLSKLTEIDEQAGSEGLSVFRVLVRPIAYCLGLLLFLLFDENTAQFIYSQF